LPRQHQEELDQVFLNGRHQGLNNEYVALTTIGLKLHAQAVVCKSLDL